jgi:deazaflavin-dependent oxidoreductase (nitroreductase family)
MTDSRYFEPGWFTRHIFNRAIRRLTRMGLSVSGSRELRVQGRKSGEWRTTPVNLLTIDGERYLVAPRGVTQWVRNLRASGTGELRVGRRVERFRGEEIADDVKGPILREYVRRWGWEVGQFFEGINAKSSDEELAAIADGFPVFRVVAA